MAFVPDTNDPNAQNQPGQQSPMNQAPQTATGGASTSTNVPAGTSQGAASVPGSTQAPPVQDLQAYLTANAPQAVGMGQQIAGGLNQEYQTAVGNVNSAQTAQDQSIQSGSVAPNTDLVSSAAADPTQFVQNPQNVQDFLAQENAQYTGPSADTTTAAINSVNLPTAPDVSQEAGVHQLVRGMETNPTTGMENLDSLLLQENPDAMAPIQAATPQFANLPGLQTSAATTESNAIDKAIADAQAAQAGVQTAFNGPGGVVPTFQAGVNQELTNDIGQANTYNEGLNKLISELNGASSGISGLNSAVGSYNSQIAPTTADINNNINAVSGIPESQHDIFTGLTPSGDIAVDRGIIAGMQNPLTVQSLPATPSAVGMPTINQAATPQDIAKQNALETLLGSNYTPNFNATGQTTFKSPGNAPTAAQEIEAILANLNGQNISQYVGGYKYIPGPGVNMNSNKGVPDFVPGSSVGITSAENALQQYLASLA